MRFRLPNRSRSAGFSLVELTFYLGIGLVVVAISASIMRSNAILAVKNSNLIRSHEDLRSAYDRLAHALTSAGDIPTLVDATGAAVSSGNAAGIAFDEILGDPYVLSPALTGGSIAATATSVSVLRATDEITAAERFLPGGTYGTRDVSNLGFILLINRPGFSPIRSKISSITIASGQTGDRETMTLNLVNQIGTAISWQVNEPTVAKIIRAQAFIVVPVGTKRELRFYPDFESTPSNFIILTDQVGNRTGEDTPFSIVDYNGDKIVKSILRVRERDQSNVLADRGDDYFYSYFQLHVNLPSRFRPRSTITQ